MEIQQIKSQLTLSNVLHHYHLKPDKNMRMCCPFHEDKTPSMQVYYKTHTAYCFSSNCKTHGKSLDVIDFIMYMDKCTKREAILKAKEMINGETSNNKNTNEVTRTAVLTKMFTYFKNAVHNSKTAKEYLEKRGLDFTQTEVGYNSGQFHHGTRKKEALIKSCVKYGLLLDLGLTARTGNVAYKPFGKWCVVFALKDRGSQIVSMYFRSTLEKKDVRHFYLRDRQGLYPGYPAANAKRLILAESIIDAASLLEQESIKSKYEVLALFGTNGLTAEHQQAIKEMKKLEEIIFFLNGDEAGKSAVNKYASLLKGEYPEVTISNVEVPENEDVNSLLQGHSGDVLVHLIESRKEYKLIFSNEFSIEKKGNETEILEVKEVVEEVKKEEKKVKKNSLDTNNPYNLKYQGNEARYQIKGFKINQLDSLKITLQVTEK